MWRAALPATTLDDYIYTPDDVVMEGEPEAGKRYGEGDFNKVIVIDEREKKRVDVFMAQIYAPEKTLVFCASQAHARVDRRAGVISAMVPIS